VSGDIRFLLEKALPELQASTNLALVDICVICPSAANLMDIHSVTGRPTIIIMNIASRLRDNKTSI
jgi:hypothetical protein